MIARAGSVRRDVRRPAQIVLQPPVQKVISQWSGGALAAADDWIHHIPNPDRQRLDLLIERGDQRVVALCGDRNQLADVRDVLRERLVGIPEVVLNFRDVALQVSAKRGDVVANVAEEVEENDVEVLLSFGIGLDGAARDTTPEAEEPLTLRGARMVAAVFVPQLAPRIRTGGRRVDEPLVH